MRQTFTSRRDGRWSWVKNRWLLTQNGRADWRSNLCWSRLRGGDANGLPTWQNTNIWCWCINNTYTLLLLNLSRLLNGNTWNDIFKLMCLRLSDRCRYQCRYRCRGRNNNLPLLIVHRRCNWIRWENWLRGIRNWRCCTLCGTNRSLWRWKNLSLELMLKFTER